MEADVSLTILKNPITDQYPESDEFISQPYEHFGQNQFYYYCLE